MPDQDTGATAPVDIVVVTYNSADVITPMLDSVEAAAGDLPARVVVVDNGSTDATRELVERRTDCRLVCSENVGYGAGVNRGVAALAASPGGDGGPILVANPDLHLAAGSVRALVAELRRTDAGVVFPLLRDGHGDIARSLRREPTIGRSLGRGDSGVPLLSEVVNEPAAYRTAHGVEWATGAAMLVSRECFTRLGGFDESFFMYSEETDLCLRARDAGWQVRFTPHAEATHAEGGSGRNPDLYAIQVLNRVRLYARRHPLPAALVFAGLALARETVHAARGAADSRRAVQALLRPSSRPAQVAGVRVLRG